MKHLWLIALIWAGTAHGAARPAATLEAMLAESERIGIFNGVALIEQNGRVVAHEARGSFDSSRSRALTIRDRFNTGSIAKEFSAVALLRLAEAGKLSLDDPLSKFLTGLPPWANDIRLSMLLDYTSGLPELRWNDVRGDADARRDLAALPALLTSPGSAYRYTYMNIMARQFVIEAVTGKPFAKTLDGLFARCGMRESVVDPATSVPRVARAFSSARVDDPFDRPVSGMPFLTAGDLLKWERCLQRGSLVSVASLETLARGSTDRQGALGYATLSDGKLAKHVHHGSARNHEGLLRHDPDSDITIVLLTNSKQQKLHDIADAAVAILTDKPWRQPRQSFERFLGSRLDSMTIEEFLREYEAARVSRANELDVDDEPALNTIGYRLLGLKRMDDAVTVFELNAKRFPESGNVFDSLGEVYLAAGRDDDARIAYERAHELDPRNEHARAVVERLRKAPAAR